jgi:deoxycytidine triphosphate deaminase
MQDRGRIIVLRETDGAKAMATHTHLLDIEPVQSEEEADARAKLFKQLDPFPDIPPALLSAGDIEDYARVTAMLFPFHANSASLKPASYEVRPGRKFIRWNEDGKRIELDISEDGSFELPPNTISFIQIESKIRLPDYIAIRFNLRITHVHRGLLLGTGPLIDPGFSGVPLIPLHNLTAEAYQIQGSEGLIWVEFTKTKPAIVKKAAPPYVRRGSFYSLEPYKTDQNVNYYFDRANGLMPIRSSIPEAIKNSAFHAEEAAGSSTRAAESAQQAAVSARDAAQAATNLSTRFFRISLLAVIGVFIAGLGILYALVTNLHQYFAQIQGNVQTTQALAANITAGVDQAKSDVARAMMDQENLRRELEAAKVQIDAIRSQMLSTAPAMGRPQLSVPLRPK